MHKRIAGVVAAVIMVGMTAVFAKSPKAAKPALDGYCPVAYVAMSQAVKGDAAYSSEHKGRTYVFANSDAKKMFDAAPEKYVPAYDGWCATAVAQGMKTAPDPKLFSVKDGRAYLFSTAQAKMMFDKDPAGTIAKADAGWAKLAKAPK